ncbi:PREDICTED: aquaporin-9 [Nanorana parkeri]|uniref:aquaporin-9 n=1 Tax=Nanorana parkeri TaxID=125878 RepID=UPI0008546092|nr:PREDICTED: aquaporin-9 [Nanorana parkeri]
MGIQSLQGKMPETDNSKDSRRSSKYSTIAMQKDRSCLGKLKLRNSLAKETLSEFFGTCLLITLGCSCVASSVLSGGKAGGHLTNNLGFAMAVAMAVYATGGVSGGHINPAVSFAMCLTGRLEWVKLPFYVSAQFVGAITGSALVFGVYYEAIIKYSGGVLTVDGPNATAHIFATYPAPYLSTINGLGDQILSTALLLILVFAIFDKKNIAAPKGLEPIAIGLLIMLLGLALGMNCGGAMNPARDLGPRIFTAVAGWGYDVFTAGNNFWWIPVVGPMAGGALGAYIYILCIEAHHHNGQDSMHPVDTDQYEKHELTNMA